MPNQKHLMCPLLLFSPKQSNREGRPTPLHKKSTKHRIPRGPRPIRSTCRPRTRHSSGCCRAAPEPNAGGTGRVNCRPWLTWLLSVGTSKVVGGKFILTEMVSQSSGDQKGKAAGTEKWVQSQFIPEPPMFAPDRSDRRNFASEFHRAAPRTYPSAHRVAPHCAERPES